MPVHQGSPCLRAALAEGLVGGGREEASPVPVVGPSGSPGAFCSLSQGLSRLSRLSLPVIFLGGAGCLICSGLPYRGVGSVQSAPVGTVGSPGQGKTHSRCPLSACVLCANARGGGPSMPITHSVRSQSEWGLAFPAGPVHVHHCRPS